MPLGGYRGAEFRQKPKMMAGHKESMNNSKQYGLCTTECNASKRSNIKLQRNSYEALQSKCTRLRML